MSGEDKGQVLQYFDLELFKQCLNTLNQSFVRR